MIFWKTETENKIASADFATIFPLWSPHDK